MNKYPEWLSLEIKGLFVVKYSALYILIESALVISEINLLDHIYDSVLATCIVMITEKDIFRFHNVSPWLKEKMNNKNT